MADDDRSAEDKTTPRDLEALSQEIRVTRRAITASLAAAGTLVADAAAQEVRRRERGPVADLQIRPREPAPLRTVRRARDMLILNYRLNNLRERMVSGNPVIERINSGGQAWVVVEHPPQQVFEHAYWDGGDAADQSPSRPLPPYTGPAKPTQPGNNPDAEANCGAPGPLPNPPQVVPSRLAGRSRLVFAMPSGTNVAPWGIEGLLAACRTWPMRLDPLAKPVPPQLFGFQQIAKADTVLKLKAASQTLIISLPQEKRAAVAKDLDRAADRSATTLSRQISRDGAVDDSDVDTAIATELDRVVDRSRVPLTPKERERVSRAVEAEAAIRLIPENSAQDAQRNTTRNALRDKAQVVENAGIDIADLGFQPLLYGITPHEPAPSVTAIEMPYRIVQTPLASAGWNHADAPITHNGRTELWHTRLGRRTEEGVVDFVPQPLRAIWSPDYEDPKSQFGCAPILPVYGEQRQDLVRLTAGFNEKKKNGRTLTPKPVIADRLMLTALGATLDMEGAWGPNNWPAARDSFPNVDMESWTHKASIGRDYYVRIVNAGYLFPFGHRASIVIVTDRRFETRSDNARAAVLRQKAYLIVRERSKDYSASGYPHDRREFPFKRIEILTKQTPPLSLPGNQLCEAVYKPPSEKAFVPRLGDGNDFQFAMMGTDEAGRRIPFAMPLVFVREAIIDQFNVDAANITFSETGCYGDVPPRNQASMANAVVQYAPQVLIEEAQDDPDGFAKGDTNIPTKSMTFKGIKSPSQTPPFLPIVEKAALKLPAVQRLLGTEKAVDVAFSQIYLDHGFSEGGGKRNDRAQLFLDIVDAVGEAIGTSEGAPSQSFGGIINPNTTPASLSRKFGATAVDSAVNQVNALLDGTFDPAQFIPDAELLGFFSLKDIIIGKVMDAVGLDVPKLKTIELPEAIEARYEIQQAPLKDFLGIFLARPGSELNITTKAVIPRAPQAEGQPSVPLPDTPEVTVDGSLKAFQINLFTCIIINFDELSFVSKPGEKAKVDVRLDPNEGFMFGGALEFINRLRDLIPPLGFGDPAPFDLSPTGLSVGYAISLPPANIGVATLQNISLGARASISFTGGPPSVRFNFAERHSTFNITVSLLGGGGFAAAVVDTEGMKEIEVALEFGARLEMDFVVASGGVYVKVGIYFCLEQEPSGQTVTLTAFFELGGHVSVMGIASVSITFHLALTYEKGGGGSRLYGEGYLLIEVEVLFFSASFDIRMQRTFAGSDADPTFVQMIPQQSVWDDYCAAFA